MHMNKLSACHSSMLAHFTQEIGEHDAQERLRHHLERDRNILIVDRERIVNAIGAYDYDKQCEYLAGVLEGEAPA